MLCSSEVTETNWGSWRGYRFQPMHSLQICQVDNSKSNQLEVSEIFQTPTSAKCKSVQKPYANLPDTPVALTSASKYFQMLPGLPGALWSALRLSKRFPGGSRKHLQLWRCYQDGTRFDYEDGQIWGLLSPLYRLAGDCESSGDSCAALRETSRAAETAAQLCRILGAVISQ